MGSRCGHDAPTGGGLRRVCAQIALTAMGMLMAGSAAGGEDIALGPATLQGDGPHYVEVGIGLFDALGEDSDTAAAGRVELRLGDKLWFVGPAVGLLASFDESVFGYGGLYADLAFGPVVVTPMLAAGGYAQGDGRDLGGTFQFRTSLGLAYAFEGGARLGAQAAHISNAGIHDSNPGEEEFYLTYAVPF